MKERLLDFIVNVTVFFSYIEYLAEQARADADQVNHVAKDVASAATSVALMALQQCQQKSFEEAFSFKPAYQSVMSMERFLNIVRAGKRQSENIRHLAEFDSNMTNVSLLRITKNKEPNMHIRLRLSVSCT